MRYTKQVLAGRTSQQYDFDQACRGWAFADLETLTRKYSRLEELYEAIGTYDPARSQVLDKIAKMIGR